MYENLKSLLFHYLDPRNTDDIGVECLYPRQVKECPIRIPLFVHLTTNHARNKSPEKGTSNPSHGTSNLFEKIRCKAVCYVYISRAFLL
jgi:hypothetical protein